MPTAFSGETKGVIDLLQQMLEIGALKSTDCGDDAEALAQAGIEGLMTPGLLQYEDSFGGELVQIFVGSEGIQFSMYQDCHGWKMRLKPIITAMPADEALEFIKRLNKSHVQGPWFWDELVGWGEGEEQENPEATLKVKVRKKDGTKWLDELLAQFPCLAEKRSAPPLIEAFAPNMRKVTPPDLRALVDEFVAAVADADAYGDNAAVMVTTWDKDCYINHAHDYLLNCIHEGAMDNQDGSPFAFVAQNIKELKVGLEKIGRFFTAATKLEEWSNAHD